MGLFDGVAHRYDFCAELFSFLQYRRWRRILVSRLEAKPQDSILDICTGTGSVAIEAARTSGGNVVGIDISRGMLRSGRARIAAAGLDSRVSLLLGRAESLPFPDGCFDAVCFTYLLRYVEDPLLTIREITRVLKPGGCLASLEFGVPENYLTRGLWHLYTRGVLPVAASLVSPGWREAGAFLGPSISRFYGSYSLGQVRRMWTDSGIADVRVERPSFGGGVVMWGTRSAVS